MCNGALIAISTKGAGGADTHVEDPPGIVDKNWPAGALAATVGSRAGAHGRALDLLEGWLKCALDVRFIAPTYGVASAKFVWPAPAVAQLVTANAAAHPCASGWFRGLFF